MKRIKTAVVGCGSISDIYMTNLTNGKFTVMELCLLYTSPSPRD